MRVRSFLLVLPLVTALAALPVRFAYAQSAGELEAARGLFKDGLELEKKKDYPGALERFRKVAEIKSTAIVRYHEGFCAEKSGKWIDALDAYSRAQIDGQGDPKQKDAVEASRKAADALRPRVPRVKVKITGAAKSKAQITIDGVAVSPVLLDAGIPVDVGTHAVELVGPNVEPQKQEVTVAEKDVKEVSFEAKEASGAVTPPPPPNGGDDHEKPIDGGAKKPPPNDATTKPTSTSTTVTSVEAPTPSSGWDPVRFGLVFGLSLGSITPGGSIHGVDETKTEYFKVDPGDGSVSTDQSQWMSTGAAVELDLGLRVFPALAGYLFWQHGFLGAGTHARDLESYQVQTDAAGLGAMLDTNPRGHFGFYADLAVSYRWVKGRQTHVAGGHTDTTLTGFEPLRLKLGIAYKPSARLTFLAYLWGAGGSYSALDYSSPTNKGETFHFDHPANHTFVGIGVSGLYDLPLGNQR